MLGSLLLLGWLAVREPAELAPPALVSEAGPAAVRGPEPPAAGRARPAEPRTSGPRPAALAQTEGSSDFPAPRVVDLLPAPSVQRRAPTAGGGPVLALRSGPCELVPGAQVAVRGEAEHLVVQFRGPLAAADRQALERLGLEFLEFVPEHAHVMRVPRELVATLAARPCVRALGNLYPEDKLALGLRAGDGARNGSELAEVRVSLFPGVERAAGRALLEQAGAVRWAPLARPGTWRATVPRERLAWLAARDEVLAVEGQAPPTRPCNATAGSRSNAGVATRSPFGLDGSGVRVGVWDDGAIDATHPDLAGRVTVCEPAPRNSHATHVAGTIAGLGLASFAGRGLAPAATLYGFDCNSPEFPGVTSYPPWQFADDPIQEMREAASTYSLDLANHSWSHAIGWQCPGTACSAGSFTNSGNHALFGMYSGGASDLDLAVSDTGLLVVKAAGNDRADGNNSSQHDGVLVSGDYYDTMDDLACAKNVLTVGATGEDDRVASYSNWGPCDDGRIKPDLVACGEKLLSDGANGAYLVSSGTSMAAANVSGQLALFLDAHSRWGGGAPRPSRVKAIAVQCSADLVALPHAGVGPDYSTGYGLLDLQRMLALAWTELHAPGVKSTLAGSFYSTGETTETTFLMEDVRQEVRVTLAWTDPAGSPLAGPALVNDLDLRLVGPDGWVWMPWVMDPANPATAAKRANNAVDNVEQVSVSRAEATGAGRAWAGTWRVQVRAGALNRGTQAWDLAASMPLTRPPSAAAPSITLQNPPVSTSGRQKVKASVSAASGRAIVAVQYRIGSSPWLGMPYNGTTFAYESLVDYTVTTSATAALEVRALDDAARETRVTRTLTQSYADDHPDVYSNTGPANTLTVGAEPVSGVLEPAGLTPETGDFFKVALEAGKRYTFEVLASDGVVARLQLYDVNGTTQLGSTTAAADVAGAAAARLVDYPIGSSGTYYLKVSQSSTLGTAQPRYEYSVRVSETALVARIGASNTSGAANLTVTFSNASIGGGSSFLWDFGDGATSTSESPQHVYTSPGSYAARLTVNGSYLSNAVDVTVTGAMATDHASSAGATQNPRDTLVVDGPLMPGYLADEEDWFRVAVTAATSYAVDALQGSLHDPEVRVYSPSDLVNAIVINYRPFSDYTRAAHAVFTPAQTGTYYVRVVRNTGPAGNYTLRTRTVSSLPNLQVTALSGPSSLAVSQPGDYWVTVSNPGAQAVAEPFTVAIGAGNNTDFDTTARYVKERTWADGVPAGSSVTIPVRLWFPPSMTGSRKLFAIVNRTFKLAESDYDDNILQQGTVSVSLRSRPPRVAAGPEKSAASGSQVSLSATASDPEGGALGYSWRQLSGPEQVTISGASQAAASVSPGAIGRYRFLVTASDPQGLLATAPQDVWIYQAVNATFDVQTTSSTGSPIIQRKTGLPVSFTARNVGAHLARVDSASLKFRQGAVDVSSYYTVRLRSAGASALQTAAGATWSFDVDIGASAPPGSTKVDGWLSGVDAATNSSISDDTSASSLTWNVLAAATATIGSPSTPSSATQGQTFMVEVPVENSGDAAANGVAATLSFSGSGLSVSPRSNPTTLAPHSVGTFIFDVTVSGSASAGGRQASFQVSGTDSISGLALASSSSNLATVTVQIPPRLVIASILASRSSVSIGQSIPVTVQVRNDGGAPIDFTAEGLQVSNSRATAAGLAVSRLLPGGGATTSFSFSLRGVSEGSVSLTSATFSATDANLGTPVAVHSNEASAANVDVVVGPLLKLVSIAAARSAISVGQTIGATVVLRNDGGATADLSGETLVFSDGTKLSAPALAEVRSLGGGGSEVASFTFSVTGLASGSSRLTSATFIAVDANSGGAVPLMANLATATAPLVEVQTPPSLELTALSPSRTVLSVGQAIVVTATVRNSGQSPVQFGGARLVNSAPALSAPQLTTSVLLAGGAQTSFSFAVSGVSAGVGTLTTATFTATNANTGAAVGLAVNSASSVGLTVQSPPSLRLEQLAVSKSLVNAGQSLSTTVTVSNQGGAGANITRETLVFAGSNLVAAALNRSVTLNSGQSTGFTFPVTGVGVGVTSVTSLTVSATDVNSGRSVGIASNVASAVSVTVQSPPGFKIISISSSKTSLSVGQTFQVTVAVRNDGAGAIDVSTESLTLAGGVLTASGLAEMRSLSAGGGGASFTFTVTAASAGSSTISSATFTAVNQGIGTPVPLVANQAVPVAVAVLTPPSLVLVSLAPAQATISVGQAIPVTVTLRNDGESTASITAASLPVAGLTIPSLGATVELAGSGAVRDFQFTATGSSAGTSTLSTATFTAVDAGNGRAAPLVSNLASARTVTVQAVPSLRLVSLAASATSVSLGQTLSVTATVRNDGGAGIRFTREELIFSTTALSAPTLQLASTLAGGQTRTFQFTVTGASAGACSITSAAFAAVDANTGGALGIATNSSSAIAVTVVAAPLLKLVSLSATRSTATVGQTFQATVGLRNDGTAAANLTAAQLQPGVTRLSIPSVTQSRTAASGGGLASYTFDCTATSSGQVSLTTASVTGTNASNGQVIQLVANTATAVNLTLQQPPRLRVTGLTASRSSLSVGQTLVCTIAVKNEGEATMRLSSAALTLTTAGLAPVASTVLSDVPGGGTINLNVTLRAVQPGTVGIPGATFTAIDLNTGLAPAVLSQSAPGLSIHVRTPPRLRLRSLVSSRATASVGQTFPVTALLANDGEDAARIDRFGVRFTGSGLSLPDLTSSRSLAGGGLTTSCTLQATVQSVGAVTLTSAVLEGVSLVGGASLGLDRNDASPVPIELQSVPALRLTSLSASRTVLSTGQTFELRLTLEHAGGAPVNLKWVSLLVSSTKVVSPVLSPAVSLDQTHPTTTLRFACRVGSSSGTTAISSAVVSAVDSNTGRAVGLASNSLQPVQLELQHRPLLEVTDLRSARTVATVGQSFVVTATIRNSGMATASIARLWLRSTGNLLAATWTTPVTLAGGASRAFPFTVSGQSAGEPSISGAEADGADANSGEAVGVAQSQAAPVRLTLQSPPSLGLSDLSLPGTVATVGEVLSVVATISNAGGATARLSAAALAVTSGLFGNTVRAGPIDVPGGGAAPVTFALTALTTGAASFAGVDLTASDVNSGAAAGGSPRLPSPRLVLVKPANRLPLAVVTGPAAVYLTDDRANQASFDGRSSSDPDGDGLTYAWSVSRGEGVQLASPADAVTSVTFTRVTSAELRLRVTDERGGAGTLLHRVRAVANHSPVPLPPESPRGVLGRVVRVTGAGSDADGDSLAYAWSQAGGPPVALTTDAASVSFSPVASGNVDLLLSVSDGKGGSATAPVRVEVVPVSRWNLTLNRGYTLLSPAIQPQELDGSPVTALDLARLASASFVVRDRETPGGLSRFEVILPGQPVDADLERGKGYLVMRRDAAVTLALEGPSWPPRLPVRHLARGPALLGLLVGGSSPSESEDLRTIVGSAFAGRVLVGPDGVGRLGWHLPGLSPAFSLRTGEGYLLLIPSARDVVLPESGQ